MTDPTDTIGHEDSNGHRIDQNTKELVYDERCSVCQRDGEPCDPPATLSDALSLDGAAGSSQRRRDCSEGHLQVRDGVCEACGKSWLDSLREEVNGVKPEVPLSNVNHAEGMFSELTACIVFLSDEGYGLTADRLMDVRDGFRKIQADHARLIEAVQKKEGIKAFADLYFPPAA